MAAGVSGASGMIMGERRRRDGANGGKQGCGWVRTFLSLWCLLGSKAECSHLRALREYPPLGGIVGHGGDRQVGRGKAVASDDDRYVPEGS